MHVAIVSETYPPDVNGVALSVRALEESLLGFGHHVSLVLPGSPQASDARRLYVPGLSLPQYAGLQCGLPAGRTLRRHWQLKRPDALYVATEGPLGASAVRCARALGIPCVSAYHTRFDQYMSRYGLGLLAPLVRLWLRRLHNHSDLTLAATTGLRNELQAQGYRHLGQLPLAVDNQRFHPRLRDPELRRRWGASAESPVLLYVGRLAPEKNLPLAIRAYRLLQLRRQDARLVLVGDGPLRQTLQQQNPDLLITGALLGEDLARHYASADLFLFPSLTETFGLVTLEAMASGLATLAFADGAAAEYIRSGVNGYTVALGDERAFVQTCLTLARNPLQLRRLGRAARHGVRELSPDAVARRFERTLFRLAEHHAALPMPAATTP